MIQAAQRYRISFTSIYTRNKECIILQLCKSVAMSSSVTIRYNKLHAEPAQGKTLDLILKKVKHRFVENMSSSTADALGLSRAILCNDSLLKRLEDLKRCEGMYRGLVEVCEFSGSLFLLPSCCCCFSSSDTRQRCRYVSSRFNIGFIIAHQTTSTLLLRPLPNLQRYQLIQYLYGKIDLKLIELVVKAYKQTLLQCLNVRMFFLYRLW
jgi:hypothetical protein